MANNYCQFSEMIEDISAEAAAWVKTVLSFDLEDGASDEDFERLFSEFKVLLSLSDEEEKVIDSENWPSFRWDLIENRRSDSPEGTYELWLYSEEGYDEEHLTVFMQALIRRFVPDYIFSLTSAETCSKLRVGEFGGGWLVITKDTVQSGSTWDAVRECVMAIEKSRKEEKEDD